MSIYIMSCHVMSCFIWLPYVLCVCDYLKYIIWVFTKEAPNFKRYGWSMRKTEIIFLGLFLGVWMIFLFYVPSMYVCYSTPLYGMTSSSRLNQTQPRQQSARVNQSVLLANPILNWGDTLGKNSRGRNRFITSPSPSTLGCVQWVIPRYANKEFLAIRTFRVVFAFQPPINPPSNAFVAHDVSALKFDGYASTRVIRW